MTVCEYFSPIGRIVVSSNGSAVTGLTFSEEKIISGSDGITELTKRWLDIYFSGGIPDFTPPAELCGTPFRNTVWRLLKDIPYGKSISYGGLAEMAAKEMNIKRMSAQAIGGAMKNNPVAIIVPCHRVIASDGSIGGYSPSTDKKKFLLELEGIPYKNS